MNYPDKKICSKCKIEKQISEFYSRISRREGKGLCSWCKKCVSQYRTDITKARHSAAIIKPLEYDLKDIPGYENCYCITKDGKIWKYPKFMHGAGSRFGRWIKVNLAHNGYYRATLLHPSMKQKIFFVHRLVAYTYTIKPHNKTKINHIDGNKLNNHISNLEWVTSSENQIHAIKTGLQKIRYGSMNPVSKKVKCINTGAIFVSISQAAQYMGLSKHAISKCCNGYHKTSGGLRWELI